MSVYCQRDNLYQSLTKAFYSENIEEISRLLGSLLKARNELIKLLRFLIDTYFDHTFWDRSLHTNSAISSTLESLYSTPRRRLLFNPDFQHNLCALVYYTGTFKKHFYDREKYKCYTIDNARLYRKLENVLVCREAYGECKIVSKLFRSKMTKETAQLFDSFYYLLRRQDRKLSLCIMLYICSFKDITFDRIPQEHDLFENIKDEYVSDIIWYVWWFLIAFCDYMLHKQSHSTDCAHWSYVKQLALSTFDLFKACYIKKCREVRIHALQYVVIAMTSRHVQDVSPPPDDSKKDAYIDTLQKAIFNQYVPVKKHDTTLGGVISQYHHQSDPQPQSQLQVGQPQAQQSVPKKTQPQRKNELDYLNCLIYNDTSEKSTDP